MSPIPYDKVVYIQLKQTKYAKILLFSEKIHFFHFFSLFYLLLLKVTKNKFLVATSPFFSFGLYHIGAFQASFSSLLFVELIPAHQIFSFSSPFLSVEPLGVKLRLTQFWMISDLHPTHEILLFLYEFCYEFIASMDLK